MRTSLVKLLRASLGWWVLGLLACVTAPKPTPATPLNLAHNDNLLGPSPALQAARSAATPVTAEQLREALAAHWKVPVAWVALGNGSEDLLGRLVQATANPERGLLTHAHAYVAFRKLAEARHIPYREAPLTAELAIDPAALLAASGPDTALVALANPVNPSGAYLRQAEGEALAAGLEPSHTLLVLDSAYLEYVTAPDFADPMELLRRHPNVAVLGTFSKVYGLTQPKVGYLLARPEVLAALARVPAAPVPEEGLRQALAALADAGHVERSRQAAQQSVAELTAQLTALGLTVLPSQGNFVLARTPIAGAELAARLSARGVLILGLAEYGLPDCVRITAGTAEQNARLLAALREALPPSAPAR